MTEDEIDEITKRALEIYFRGVLLDLMKEKPISYYGGCVDIIV